MWISLVLWLVRYAGVYALCFVAGFYSHIKLENWWRGDDEVSTLTMTATAVKAESGNRFTIEAGIFGKRTRNVVLWGLEIPTEIEGEALVHLSSLINKGDVISIAIEEGHKQLSDVAGIVRSRNGANLNIEQIRMGLAKASISNKEFLTAQKEAQSAKRGIWKTTTVPPKPFPWWKDNE